MKEHPVSLRTKPAVWVLLIAMSMIITARHVVAQNITAESSPARQYIAPHFTEKSVSARHASPALSAAPGYESDILSARPIRYWFGLGPGGYYFAHQGSFSPSCDCEFRDRDGGRFMLAGEFRVQYPKLGFAWGVLVSYTDASAEFAREERRNSIVVGGEPDMEVDYRRSSNVQLQWLGIDPGVFWYIPRTQLFLRAGVEIGIPLEYRYDHRERILTEEVEYYAGGTEHLLLPEQDIPGGDRLRFAVSAGIGYDFFVTSMFAITPRVGAAIPLTSVSSSDSGWKVLTAHGLLMLNLRL